MAIINTSRSLLEWLAWEDVWDLLQERLIGRFASSQGEDAKLMCVEIDLGADKAMQPVPIDVEGVSEHP